MKIIKKLSKDMACNIREAEEKMLIATTLKEEHPEAAEWYKHMAAAHLEFNDEAHRRVADLISDYKDSDDYRKHPEYADGMMDVWAEQHKDMIADAARVRAMIDAF